LTFKKFNIRKLSYINPKVKLLNNGRGGKKEKGLFAVKDIKKGEIITISAGIGLPEKIVKRLPKSVHKYCYYMENGFFYCSLSKDKISADWFMNHSCHPNAGGVKEAFTARALRDIKKGEEITYNYMEDYKFWRYRPFRKFKCYCGFKNCKKTIKY